MRATKRQNEIIKAHFKAYENNDWGNNLLPDDVTKFIEEGNLNRAIWDWVVGRYVSPTSQLMMSSDTFGYISGNAKKDIRRGFISLLNKLNIK